MRSLVIGEFEHGEITEATRRVVTAAAQRNLPVDLFVTSESHARAAAAVSGVECVLWSRLDPATSGGDAHATSLAVASPCATPESLAIQIEAIAPPYSLIATSHRTMGRAALPRVAARLNGAFLADITGVIGPQRFFRGLYAGSVIATVETTEPITCVTVRISSFEPAPLNGTASMVELPPVASFRGTQLVERQQATHGGNDLASARAVLSGGRGIGSSENMARLESLARHLGAALGASRAAVDAGYAPNAAQVGQTGKTVAPDVYVALGISGAIQHLAGMKDSRVIIAVNKDPDAPIFSVADYGLVGDLFEVMTALETTAGLAVPH